LYQNIIILSGGTSVDSVLLGKMLRKTKKALVICCDSGARHLKRLNIIPDLLIGDMDSIDPDDLKYYAQKGVYFIGYPAAKDYTDTELAMDYALKLKPHKIMILCALGGRLDHALANIYLLLKGNNKGIETFLIDDYCEVFIINREHFFIREAGKTVSLLALTPRVSGITLTGFYYPLKKGILKMGESRGISNIISGSRANIQVEKGKLLAIKYRRKDFFPKV